MSRGVYFTFDGIFAALLISSAVFLLMTYTQHEQDTSPLQYTTSDVVGALNTLTVGELRNATLRNDILATNLADENDTVLYAIGVLWAEGDVPLAGSLIEDALHGFENTNSFGVYAENTMLYNNSPMLQSAATRIGTSKQQVSGIAPGKPLSGSTATAYLRRVENKTTNTFTYFGGFVGQGNITVFLNLPEDVNASRITGLQLELDTPQNFTLLVNGTSCGYLEVVQHNMTPTIWDLDSCIPSLGAGNNSFSFLYENISNAYMVGGYIKATYTSDLFTSSANRSVTQYRFPQIEGVANLFDAFVVPQTLRNLTVDLHYYADDPSVLTYLTIGEKTVWSSNLTGDVRVKLTDANLTLAGLDYAFLSNKTVPVRFSAFNSTSTVLTTGNADVVVVTDYSGSMMKSISDDTQGNSGNVANCETHVYADASIRRTHLARCLDKEVVDILLNESFQANTTGNRLWPVHYVRDTVYNYMNPQDREALVSYYETYTHSFPQQGRDKTCIACALSEAYEIFNTYNESNRSRFIILMSDGLPTHCTAAGCSGISSAYGSEVCGGYCDASGSCSTPPAICTNSACKPAMDNALAVAQQLKDDFNVTVFTVGFGPVGGCDNATHVLRSIADMTNGTFQHSTNVDELLLIYHNISYSIMDRLILSSQTLAVRGDVVPSILYNDSFITAVHDTPALPPQNMIEITRQTPQFGTCNPVVTFPSQLILQEANVVSYSGIHWTDSLVVNGNTVFNLSEFLVPYHRLGDPYRVSIPPTLLGPVNTLSIHAGDNATDPGGCSVNNTLVYTAYVPSATPRSAVLENAEGCTWTIERDDGTTQVNAIPQTYTGANTCSYTNALQTYDNTDSLQAAVYALLQELDFDSDGRIFVSLSEENLEVIVTKIGSVPYLWGPSLIEVRMWQ